MNFDLLTIEDLGILERGRSRHRPRDDKSLYGGIYPFIQTGDVKHAPFYISSYSQTYNEKGLAQSKLWGKGTLCITIAANIADTAFLGFNACFPDSILGFTPYKTKSDAKFIKYCFDVYKTTLEAISKGTTQDNLSLEKIKKVRFKIPALHIQRKIAAVLSAYDDLIENNNRRIAILEKMAEELYREWFVRLRFPGHEKVKIVKGVPEGWEVKKLKDILELAYGKALKDEHRMVGNAPVYGSSGIVGYHNKALVKGPGIVVGRKGNVGSVIWVNLDFYPIDTTYYVKSEYPLEYLYYLIQSMNFINNDAAVPGLNREQAYANKFYFPDSSLIDNFVRSIKPLFRQKDIFKQKNESLSITRDRLLARLMSGKIDLEKLDIHFPQSMLEETAGEPGETPDTIPSQNKNADTRR
ncbi:restriction endonuclease subunit S [Desulforegula conservatrix]|uniref:restriction endonuclease subunit S n=1 Tax=Desulforegula conservatrix TaxID=153026 RepID=UPI000A02A992|nr:restriction endonuclease subunit S [Desulforegula conservatrix]